MTTTNEALTLGVIAKKLDCSVYKIDYLIRSRGIQEVQRVGRLRVFSPEALDILKQEVESKRAAV